MAGDPFGANPSLPEDIREIFIHLCQDVASLHYKWDFYQDLFAEPEDANLLSDMAGWAFQIIEESVRKDMAMAISRLSDPAESFGHENISLANLARRCPGVSGIDTILSNFQAACATVKKYRDKMIGHNDLKSRIEPHENPVPGIAKSDIDTILARAADLLNAVSRHYSDQSYVFDLMFPLGGAESLLHWLSVAKHHRDEEQEHRRRGLC